MKNDKALMWTGIILGSLFLMGSGNGGCGGKTPEQEYQEYIELRTENELWEENRAKQRRQAEWDVAIEKALRSR